MSTDSREARIEAEAVTDAAVTESSLYLGNSDRCHLADDGDFGAACVAVQLAFIDGAKWATAEAARKARASNDACGEPSCAKVAEYWYAQPAPDRVSRIEAANADSAETVHLCPPGESALTPCCGRSPFELRRDSRLTNDPAMVTCDARLPARIASIEAALDTLFAAVGLAPDAMNSAWIAAKKRWEGRDA